MWFQKPQPVRPVGERKMEESKVEAIEVPENHLSIGTWNACGLTKQKEVEILKSGLDIIGITETGKGREKDPPGYVWFGDNGQRTQRGRRTHGGAGFYVKQHLASLCDVVKEEPNRLWI
ncbi:MAG: hypothetical protein D6698_10505 [Gammaproteobacteria bacterium]|nr:MAG: hypothetical protein D6698_10505 [Gammaproteobacteria bacterium]